MIPLLLIEDEERIAGFVTKGFAAEGYAVHRARTGPVAGNSVTLAMPPRLTTARQWSGAAKAA